MRRKSGLAPNNKYKNILMALPDTSPDAPESDTTFDSNLSQYVTQNPIEILDILRSVMDSGALVSLYFGHGGDFVLTSILDLDKERLVLDFGPDESLNRRALASVRLRAVTQHDRVRVEFASGELVKIVYQGRPAFAMPTPDQLLRLQRRAHYRLTVPVTNPPRCSVAIPEFGRADMKVVDISCGGVSLTGYPKGFRVATAMVFPDSRIELPSIGAVNVTLEVRNVFDVQIKAGIRGPRSGCMFVDAQESTAALIQRYIMKVERERKALLG